MMVYELTPGDVITVGESRATFIARTQHPLYPSLCLVVWVLDNGQISLDALASVQDIGNPYGGGKNALRDALLEQQARRGPTKRDL